MQRHRPVDDPDMLRAPKRPSIWLADLCGPKPDHGRLLHLQVFNVDSLFSSKPLRMPDWPLLPNKMAKPSLPIPESAVSPRFLVRQ